MDEIVKTRKNYLGSSDAKMVARVAKRGHIAEADKNRLAIMLGLAEHTDSFTNKYIEDGINIENAFYSLVKEKYPEAKSNPIFVSREITPKNFRVMNHIDVEIDGEKIIWFEHKATQHENIEQVEEEYKWQLQWHYMLLEERAEGKNFALKLAWFDTVNNQFSYKTIERNDSMVETLKKGIEIIDQACENFQWQTPEEMPVEYMPEAIQERISETVDALKVIESLNQKVDEFKQKILQAMQEHNIKSIKNDALSITFVPESETVSFDTKRFAKENPELAKNYEKKIVKKPYIIIKLK